MTNEEKQLLLIDLCARLPYGFTVYRLSDNANIKISDISDFAHFLEYSEGEEFKPYLRPMSSMTSKEWLEYCDACVEDEKSWTWAGKEYKFTSITHREDFLNSHHFDYRGLIPMDLALEAPEGMYKTE